MDKELLEGNCRDFIAIAVKTNNDGCVICVILYPPSQSSSIHTDGETTRHKMIIYEEFIVLPARARPSQSKESAQTHRVMMNIEQAI